MTNEIYKSGRMYVVWHKDEDVASREDGIDKVIESIGATGAEYAQDTEVATKIVRDWAIKYFDVREFNPLNGHHDEPNHPERIATVEEFGRRAIYEVRVKLVGYADAKGRFTETPFQAKELFPTLNDTIEELVQTHQNIHFEVYWGFQLEYYAFKAIRHLRDDINSVEGRRALQFQSNASKGSFDCTQIHTPKLDCSDWKFLYKYIHLTKYLAESMTETEVKRLYEQYEALVRKTK